MDFENIFALIFYSKQDFNRFLDPAIAYAHRIADSSIFWAGILDFACN